MNQKIIKKLNTYLEEDFSSIGSSPSMGISDSDNDNKKSKWKNRLLGAGLGAAGLGALTVGTDAGHEMLDNLYKMDQNDTLWDTAVGKVQKGLEHLKFGENGSSASENFNSNNTSFGGNFLKRIFGGSPSENPDVDKLHVIAYKYAGANDEANSRLSSIVPFYGEGYAGHLKSWLTGGADVEADKLNPEEIQKFKAMSLLDQTKTAEQLRQATQQALSDGKITPDEAEKINELQQKYNDSFLQFNNSNPFTRLFSGSDAAVAEQYAEKQLQNSIDWAQKNGFHFLLNGDIKDDIAFFDDLKQKLGGIPPQLQPIYNAVIREVRKE